MKKTVKMFLILLIVIMALSTVLAGCGSKKAENTGEMSAKPGDDKASTEPVKKSDMTLTVYDRGTIPAEEGTVEDNRWTKWISETGPVNAKFVAIPRWESMQKMNTLFASGAAPELILEFDPAIKQQWFTQKQLQPIDEMIEKYSTDYKKLLETYPQIKKLAVKSDGKMYEFGRVQNLRTNHFLYIRADWLKKLNLEAPKTIDELYTVAKAFAEQDPDGNSKKDTYGMSLSFVSGLVLASAFQNVSWVVENGELVRDWDRATAMTTFMKKLYDEGIVDKDFVTDKNGAKAQQDFITGKLGIYGANAGGEALGFALYDSFKKNVPAGEIIPIALPKTEFGQFSPVLNPPIQLTAVVNVGAKNTEGIMKYVDFMSTEATMKTLKYGLDGTHSKAGANGCYAPIDAEKFKQEVSYTGDLAMLTNPALEGKCALYSSQLNADKPLEAEFLNIIKLADEAYLSPERPVATFTEYMPQLPEELQLISKNGEKSGANGTLAPGNVLADNWVKAVISGAAYTPEQAMTDSKAAWDKIGGKKLEEFYKSWYAENKDKAFMQKDLYTFK
ncbi:type 2 periplasmic-binding domain-containing protein [Paenibacillus psychroresistens]|nr:extracellular solute-binding protein [Paenibacillus psychroresistens]